MKPHPLMNLLICPRTKSDLDVIDLGAEQGLLAQNGGILYPVIDGIVLMEPSAPKVKDLCRDFLARNQAALEQTTGFDLEATRKALGLDKPEDKDDWHAAEMAYWESRFEQRLLSPNPDNPGWNRSLPRSKMLERLPEDFHRRVILEIGCGSSHTLFDIFGVDIPNYIGLDLSYYACAVTRKSFPQGLFLQASAETPPFKENALDAVVSYGVFHHLPRHEENLKPLMPLLKPNGYVIGSDPVPKPSIPRPYFLKKTDSHHGDHAEGELDLRTGMSPHNEWIDWDNMLLLIKENGRVLDSFNEYSPLRHLLVSTLYDRLGLRTKFFTRIMMAVDNVWLNTVGRLHRSLGPSAVHYVIQKI